MEVRELLSKYEFPGQDADRDGSAKLALEGEDSELGVKSIFRLGGGAGQLHSDAEAGDRRAVPDAGGGRVFDSGRGTVVTGRVERGVVKWARRSRLSVCARR